MCESECCIAAFQHNPNLYDIRRKAVLFCRHFQHAEICPQWAADAATAAVGPSVEDLIAVRTEQTRAVAVLAHFVVVVLHQITCRKVISAEIALVEWGHAKGEVVQGVNHDGFH